MFKPAHPFAKLRPLALALSLYATAPLVSFALPQIPPSLAVLPPADSDDLAVKISTYQQYIADHRDDQTPEGRKTLLLAMTKLAIAQGKKKQLDNSISTSVSIIKNYEADPNPDFRAIVASVKSMLGSLYSDKKKWAEAIKIYDQLISEYKNDKSPDMREIIVEAKYQHALLLIQQGNKESALTELRRLASEIENDTVPEIRTTAVEVNRILVVSLLDDRKFSEGVQLASKTVQKYENDTDDETRVEVLKTRFSLGSLLELTGKLDLAPPHFQQIIETPLFPTITEANKYKSLSLLILGGIYQEKSEHGLAIQQFERLLRDFVNDNTPEVYEAKTTAYAALAAEYSQPEMDQTSKALEIVHHSLFKDVKHLTVKTRPLFLSQILRLANYLYMQGENEAIIEIGGKTLAEFGNDSDPAIRLTVADIMLTLRDAYSSSYARDEALKINQQLISRTEHETDPAQRERYALALLYLIDEETAPSEDLKQRLQSIDRLINAFQSEDRPSSRRYVARAMRNLAQIHYLQQDNDAAIQTYKTLLATYGDDTYIGTRREVAESMQNLLMLQLNTQRDAEAASTYQQFKTRFAKDNDPLIEAVANRVKDLMQDREAK